MPKRSSANRWDGWRFPRDPSATAILASAETRTKAASDDDGDDENHTSDACDGDDISKSDDGAGWSNYVPDDHRIVPGDYGRVDRSRAPVE